MKKKILIGVIIGLILLCLCIFLIDKNRVENIKEPISVIEQNVIIKNNQIKNENLIDEFIQNANNKKGNILEINVEGEICKLEFIEAQENTEQYNEDGLVTVNVPQYNGKMSRTFDIEYAKKYFGYYKATYSDGVINEYSPLAYGIKRMIRDNNVIVYFAIISPTVDIASTDDLKKICEYSLESSNYKKLVDLSYHQRKDMGLKKIAEKNEFDNENFQVHTLGGDVYFTVEKDMVYDFRKALEEKVITLNNIIEQVNLDYKYGICGMNYFYDGGSVEYLYNDYTILKCNSLDGNINLYIGFRGTILNIINELNYIRVD